MSNKMKNHEEPAFPIKWDDEFYIYTGMTKREQFALAAMQGLLSSSYHSLKDIPSEAVKLADATLDELEKTND